MNKPRLIDANVTSNIISGMIKPLTTPDGCGVRDYVIQAYNEGLINALESIHNQPTAYDIDKVEKDIHEYFKGQIDIRTEGLNEYPMGLISDILEYNKAICGIVKKGGLDGSRNDSTSR